MNETMCDACGATVTIGEWPFCPHGIPHVVVVGDDIPGGLVLENLDRHPTRYYTKSAIRQRMNELGVENRVRHIGVEGTDKSPHTTRWI